MIKPLLIALSAILISPNFVDKDIQSGQLTYNGKEKFSPQLSFINSIDKLEMFVDQAAIDKNIAIGSLAYAEMLENVVAHRFYNGTAHKTLSQDWMSAITDKVTGTGYSRVVDRNEIMQRPNADCSQQATVMMEVLKRKNIICREVLFTRHCALEAFVNGGWYFLDANGEPGIQGQQRLHQNWYGQADNLKNYYTRGMHPGLPDVAGTGQVAALNKSTGVQQSNLSNFHVATGVLSKILWLFPLIGMLVYRKRPFKMYALKPIGKYVRMQPLRPVYNS